MPASYAIVLDHSLGFLIVVNTTTLSTVIGGKVLF
jgi:hypothetical protein